MEKNKEYYNNLQYPIVIKEFIDEGEKIFSAEIIELPGLKVYGDSAEEVLEEINEAKEAWIEFNLSLDRKINEPNVAIEYSGRVTLRIPKSMHKELKSRADYESVSLNSYINYIINEGLRKTDITTLKDSIFSEFKNFYRNIIRKTTWINGKTDKILEQLDENNLKKQEFHFYLDSPDDVPIYTKTNDISNDSYAEGNWNSFAKVRSKNKLEELKCM